MAEVNETRSNEILNYLTSGLDFSVPDIDFNDDAFKISDGLIDALQRVPEPLTEGLLTERKVDGKGLFDGIMQANKAHLKMEFDEGRITGAEYTKAYVAMMQGSLQFAVQYLLGRDQAYYGALGSQVQAITANIDAYTAKVRLAIAKAQAHQNKAQYAATVLQLGSIDKQTDLVKAQTVTQEKQQVLLHEQAEQAHAQTSDTKLDDATEVGGYQYRQNKLVEQQRTSFKKDAIIKAAKIYTDSLATQMSMDKATVAGTGMDAAGIAQATTRLQATMTDPEI